MYYKATYWCYFTIWSCKKVLKKCTKFKLFIDFTLSRVSYMKASRAFLLSLVCSMTLSWWASSSSFASASDSSALDIPPYMVSVTGISSLLDSLPFLFPSAYKSESHHGIFYSLEMVINNEKHWQNSEKTENHCMWAFTNKQSKNLPEIVSDKVSIWNISFPKPNESVTSCQTCLPFKISQRYQCFCTCFGDKKKLLYKMLNIQKQEAMK